VRFFRRYCSATGERAVRTVSPYRVVPEREQRAATGEAQARGIADERETKGVSRPLGRLAQSRVPRFNWRMQEKATR
jgi:hypothetical protein